MSIVIRHCLLRIVRCGGWSWGPNPARLVKLAKEALPQLLAGKLEGLLQRRSGGTISAPLRITVRARLEDLMALAISTASAGEETASDAGRIESALEEALRTAICAAAPSRKSEELVPAGEPETSTIERAHGENKAVLAVTPPSLLALLAAWRAAGDLGYLLRLLGPATLEAWHAEVLRILANNAGGKVAAAAEAIDSVDAIVAAVHAGLVTRPEGRADVLRRRLAAMCEVLERSESPVAADALERALERHFPLDTPRDETRADLAGRQRAGWLDRRGPAAPFSWHGLRGIPSGDYRVSSVLPFLLLGPLSRIGYLEALTAALVAAGLVDSSPFFAAALAYKVSLPLERGWQRRAEARAAARVFAGVEDEVRDEDLYDFGRRAAGLLDAADAVLARSLLRGRAPDDSFVLLAPGGAHDGSIVLIEPEGCFAVAWVDGVEVLTSLVPPRSMVVVPAAAAGGTLLGALERQGIRFLTDTPATRGEGWREVRVPGRGAWWTNDPQASAERLARALVRVEGQEAGVAALMDELVSKRLSVPRVEAPALERSVTLAASLGLGSIAWELWREREQVDPTLALERLGNLDGVVRFRPDGVELRIALGRRLMDLEKHGFTGDVLDVPWLGGRPLRMARG